MAKRNDYNDHSIEASDAERARQLGHEPIEINVRAVWIAGAVLGIGVFLAGALMLLMLRTLSSPEGTVAASRPQTALRQTPDSPDSAADQAAQLRQLRTRERAILSEYAWVDPEAGIARIPIEQAMEIIAEQGLPSILVSPLAPATAADAPAETPSQETPSQDNSSAGATPQDKGEPQ